MQPAPGSAAARRAQLERERPGLYAARHVAKGVGQALLAVIGVALALNEWRKRRAPGRRCA